MTHRSHDVPAKQVAARAVLILCLTGCGATSAGPLPGDESVGQAARDSLTCGGEVYAEGEGQYDGRFAAVEGTPERALDNWLARDARAPIPPAGYRQAGGAYENVVFTFEDGVVAVVLRDDVRDWTGEVGWGVTSWALCDPLELSAEGRSSAGFTAWEDGAGDPVPGTRVISRSGPEACGWEDLTVLTVEDATYVRDEAGRLPDRLLRAAYDGSAELPVSARDSGYRQDGRELWLTGRGGRAAYVVDGERVEQWPAAREVPDCG